MLPAPPFPPLAAAFLAERKSVRPVLLLRAWPASPVLVRQPAEIATVLGGRQCLASLALGSGALPSRFQPSSFEVRLCRPPRLAFVATTHLTLLRPTSPRAPA